MVRRGADTEVSVAVRQTAKRQKDDLQRISCRVVCTGQAIQPAAAASWPDASQVTGHVNKSQLVDTLTDGGTPDPQSMMKYLNEELQEKRLVMDGSISSLLGEKKLQEADYRGDEFQDSKVSLKGNDDVLVLTRPELIVDIHKEYLNAGADICRTNTFNSNAISQGPYGLQHRIYELNKSAAMLAKRAAAEVTKEDSSKPRFVAGVVGPTSYSLSKACSSSDSVSRHASHRKNSSYVGQSHAPECKQYGTTTDRFGHVGTDAALKGKYFSSRAWREMQMWPSANWPEDGIFDDVTFDEMLEVYLEQIHGLMDGGVDLLMFEAVADTINAKAAIYALEIFYEQFRKERVPLIINARLSPSSGRMPGGQSIQAFFISIKHAKPIAVGIDGCSATEMKTFYNDLSRLCSTYCSACPAAESSSASPNVFATSTASLEGCNIVGGGSGTLPAHITELAQKVAEQSPRRLPRKAPRLMLAGLDPFFADSSPIQLVGQRCNLMGGKRFRELAYQCKFHSALEVCADQIQCGADLLDVNFDSTRQDFDAHSAMTTFLSFVAGDSEVAKVPLMVGSHLWPIIEAGLKHVQGKSVISAIGLTLSEDKFLLAAEKARRLGAALVIRAMDQDSKGESYDEKVRICEKSYQLLRSKLDFPAEDIIFDCHLEPLGFKGSKSTRGIDFINAVEQLKRTCPDVSFIVGLSNLSLPFRWIPELREAMHSIFLQHATSRGLNFAMVDPGRLPQYSEIEPQMLRVCEDLILNDANSDDVVDRFTSLAAQISGIDIPAQLAGGFDAHYTGQHQMIPSLPDTYQVPHYQARQPLHTVIQSSSGGGSLVGAFSGKAQSCWHLHRIAAVSDFSRYVTMSSISAWMGQGASGIGTAASCILDSMVFWNRSQQMGCQAATLQWGPIGEIGLRIAMFQSRDPFALAGADIGQELIGAADTAAIERAVIFSPNPPEFLTLAYVGDKYRSQWEGKVRVQIRNTDEVTTYKLRTTTPMSKVIDAYLRERNQVGMSVQLAYKGQALAEEDTFLAKGMNDGDFIDAIEF